MPETTSDMRSAPGPATAPIVFSDRPIAPPNQTGRRVCIVLHPDGPSPSHRLSAANAAPLQSAYRTRTLSNTAVTSASLLAAFSRGVMARMLVTVSSASGTMPRMAMPSWPSTEKVSV